MNLNQNPSTSNKNTYDLKFLLNFLETFDDESNVGIKVKQMAQRQSKLTKSKQKNYTSRDMLIKQKRNQKEKSPQGQPKAPQKKTLQFRQQPQPQIPTQNLQVNQSPQTSRSDSPKSDVRTQEVTQEVLLKQEEIKKNMGWLSQQMQNVDQRLATIKTIKFKLNQVVPDNLDHISQYLIQVIKEDNSLAEDCASLIVEKAGLEPRYRELYAKVCSRLVASNDLDGLVGNRLWNIFKYAIINRVQEVFVTESPSYSAGNSLHQLGQHELQMYTLRKKFRFLGCILFAQLQDVRFIGCLLIENILTEGIFHNVQGSLLQSFISRDNAVNPEFYLEQLIELYDKAGRHLQNVQKQRDSRSRPNIEQSYYERLITLFNEQSQDENDETYTYKFSLDTIMRLQQWNNIKSLQHVSCGDTSTRIKVLITNLLCRYRNGWRQHINVHNQPAKTLFELRFLNELEHYGQIYGDYGDSIHDNPTLNRYNL